MASPEVGGRYHIERPPGYFWIVEHEARDASGQWCLRRIEGPWATIEEAKTGARPITWRGHSTTAERVGDCRVHEFRARAASGGAAS